MSFRGNKDRPDFALSSTVNRNTTLAITERQRDTVAVAPDGRHRLRIDFHVSGRAFTLRDDDPNGPIADTRNSFGTITTATPKGWPLHGKAIFPWPTSFPATFTLPDVLPSPRRTRSYTKQKKPAAPTPVVAVAKPKPTFNAMAEVRGKSYYLQVPEGELALWVLDMETRGFRVSGDD